MNILFVNRDTGCGVEFVGDLFIEILSHVKGIDSISIFKSQDNRFYDDIDYNDFDLVILNDFYKELDKPTISLYFSGDMKDITSDIMINYNQLMYFNYSGDIRRALNLNFISGNIWENKKDWNKRSDNILYVSRLSKSKILEPFLRILRLMNKTLDFYGLITDVDYYNEYKDVIKYKGFVNHKDLIDVYNEYKSIYLFSDTECLSMTMSEALLCGCVPVIYDCNNFSQYLGDFCIRVNGISIPKNTEILEVKRLINNNSTFIKNCFSFDKMVLDFIFYIRALMLKDLKFDKTYTIDIKLIKDADNERPLYISDTIDWTKSSL